MNHLSLFAVPVLRTQSLQGPRLILLFLLVAGLASVASAQTVAIYTFDDGTAADSSGNRNNGRLQGNPQPDQGIRNGGLRFGSPQDGVLVRHSPSLDTSEIAVSLWFRLDAPPGRDLRLLRKRLPDAGYELNVLRSGVLRFDVSDSGGTASVSSVVRVVPNVWTAVTVTHAGDELRIYMHGNLVSRAPADGRSHRNNAALRIGQGFAGRLDDVRIVSGPVDAQVACEAAGKIWHEGSAGCLGGMAEIGAQLGLQDLDHLTFGATLGDANDDGWIDLYYVNGLDDPPGFTPPPPSGTCPDLSTTPDFLDENRNAFFLNRGDGTFFPDSAPAIGLDDGWNAMRHAWADYDNDGLRDVLSHNFLVSPLYRAVSHDPLQFVNANDSADLHICLIKGTGASWVDVNNDGFLDIHVGEYNPNRPANEMVNQLYIGGPAGTFTEVTAQAGMDLVDNPMGQICLDFDNDGDQDIFMTNSHAAPSRLYRNDGPHGPGAIPQFTDVGGQVGVAVVGEAGRGFGSAAADFDNDGFMDLLFVREEDSRLFRNNGPDGDGNWSFTDVTNQGGLDFVGIYHDGAFADLDNDGWQDLVLANADSQGPNSVFMNHGDGTWSEVAVALGMDHPTSVQRGVVPGDIDNDGDLDVVFTSFVLGDPNFLHRNEALGNNWVQFRLRGVESNRDAVGARIEVTAVLGPGQPAVTQTREIVAGTGFFSDIPRIQSFGLGQAIRILEARVLWPSGIVQTLGPVPMNRRVDVVEAAAPVNRRR